jgi:TM2 domain-containing membrane protein YozV
VEQTKPRDPDTAFLIELVGGLFGLLGLGYIYVGRTNDGLIRLIPWMIYIVIAYVIIVSAGATGLGLVIAIPCCAVQFAAQIGVPIWSASTLKREMLAQRQPPAV